VKAHLPKVGTRWRQKARPDRVAVITYFKSMPHHINRGYVRHTAWWVTCGDIGKCLDTFLKSYERCS